MTSDFFKCPALGPLLATILSPGDVKKLADESLPELAAEIEAIKADDKRKGKYYTRKKTDI